MNTGIREEVRRRVDGYEAPVAWAEFVVSAAEKLWMLGKVAADSVVPSDRSWVMVGKILRMQNNCSVLLDESQWEEVYDACPRRISRPSECQCTDTAPP